MNGELFSLVMKHFVQYSGSTIENPSILILDNHESHLSVETLNIAKKNGVIMVTLPPHCSHRLQPLDISVFASFEAHYISAVDSWLLHHPGIPLTIYDVAACVGLKSVTLNLGSKKQEYTHLTNIFFQKMIF